MLATTGNFNFKKMSLCMSLQASRHLQWLFIDIFFLKAILYISIILLFQRVREFALWERNVNKYNNEIWPIHIIAKKGLCPTCTVSLHIDPRDHFIYRMYKWKNKTRKYVDLIVRGWLLRRHQVDVTGLSQEKFQTGKINVIFK